MEENKVNIPEGWGDVELGHFFNERPKSSLKVSEASNFGNYPFFTSGDAVLKHDIKQLDGENIFLATGGVANVKYYNGNVSYSTDTYTITTKGGLKSQYLYFFLQNIISYINANYFQGSGLKHLQKKDLKKHRFIYPTSPTEQQTIVTILSKVDEAITQTEALITKYNRIKTGLMQDLLTKGIDKKGNIRNEETHEFKDSPLGRIPKEWEVGNLESLLMNNSNSMRSGPFGSSLTKSEWIDSGIPYLGIDNVHREKFVSIYNRYITPEKFNQLKRYAVAPKDVMITIMGTVGRSCVVPDDIGDAISSKHIWTMSFNQAIATPELICYQLNYSPWIISALKGEVQGGVMPSINSKTLKRLLFPIPKKDEQNAILQMYNKIQSLLECFEVALQKLVCKKTGLMQDLLSGKVRVNNIVNETSIA